MSDPGRMEEVYRRRESLHPAGTYSLLQPGQLYMIQRRERSLVRLLSRTVGARMADLRILDLGSGGGEWLTRFLLYGGEPERLVGLEIQGSRARRSRRLFPSIPVLRGDGARLPFPDDTFDLVHQATVLTLVLNPEARSRIAAEMLRVVRPDGLILWFDFRYSNPRNPDVRGIGRAELRRLFPGRRILLRSLSLAPPLARPLARLSFTACRLLEILPPLRSHYLAAIFPSDRVP